MTLNALYEESLESFPPRPRRPGMSSDSARITIMGGFRFFSAGTEVEIPEASERLLAYLAVQDRPIHRLKLAAIFWPDASDRQSLANLRSALWRLVGSSHDALDVGTRSIALKRSVQVDLRDATSLAHWLVDKRRTITEEHLATASNFLRDDLLPGWYDDWAVQEFERWRQLRLHGLEALAQRLVAAGRFAAALDAALLCVEADPLRETAHAEVIKTHLAEHNQSEAIRAFDLYCSTLHSELGLEPSEHLRALVGPAPVMRLA